MENTFSRVQVHVTFSNSKVYDISRFDVNLNQEFNLEVHGVQRAHWSSDNDPVLDIRVQENTTVAKIKSTEIGESRIVIKSHGFKKVICINVKDSMAGTLEIKADTPVSKF